MKKLFFIATVLLSLQSQATVGTHEYELSITNLTKGQPITPPVLAVSTHRFNLYTLGEEASQGLKDLSQDGKTELLKTELEDVGIKVIVGKGLTMPGQKQMIRFNAREKDYVSLAGMLAKTNDAFVGARNIPLRLKRGESKSLLINTYDSGAELNNESMDFIPAFGSSASTVESEGFVHPHPGIYGIADLKPETDAFSSMSAKITIKRTH